MKKLLALASLSIVLAAATPGPDPVVSMKGLGEAVTLSAEVQTVLEPRVKALNTALEKFAAIKPDAPDAAHARQLCTHEAMVEIHAIMLQLTPEQRVAFHHYLHGQMKEAGIHIEHPQHGTVHPAHGHVAHGGVI